jgi:cell fate regulator YaaT (PSP1 superfamily)
MANTHYVGIKFSSSGKAYYFGTDIPDLKIGQKVVAESIRGLQLGEVATPVYDISSYKSSLELKPMVRVATDDDILLGEANKKRAKQAIKDTLVEIEKLGLDMNPIDAEFALDGSKVTITYIADERVDFRELLKVLASKFRCRIELRQVGPRDRAKMVGGIGLCGLPLCCKRFSAESESVSINRAKNQMLSLNIPKLSGHCGKLICCLLYEDDAYTDLKKDFPPLGTLYERDDGKVWKVVSYNVFSRHVKMSCEEDFEFVPLDEALKFKKVFRKNQQ